MDKDGLLWLRLWQSIIIGSVLVTCCFSGCTVHQNNKIAEAIKNGVPAERARIAFSQTSETEKAIALITAGK